MNEQLSFEEAKRLSIIKWEATIEQGGDMYDIPLKIQPLKHYCGFCQRHKIINNDIYEKDCNNCEFGKVAGECVLGDSLFNNWFISNNEYKVLKAKRILECIKSLKENS